MLLHVAGSSCAVLFSDSIVAGTLPRRILPSFRWRRDGQSLVCIHDEIQLDPAVCCFAGNCTVAQRAKAGQYCARHVGRVLRWTSKQASVFHASILSVAQTQVLRLDLLCVILFCVISFRILCILYSLLLPVLFRKSNWKASWSCFGQSCKDDGQQSRSVREGWQSKPVREALSQMSLLSSWGRRLCLQAYI